MQRPINLNALLAFVTVAREGSVSAAAEALSLTQPAISHQIKRLNQETGLTLFNRTPTGLQLTREGANLLTQAERVLETASDFQRSARKQSGRISGRLRVGTVIDPEFIRLGQLLKNLKHDHPDIQTELMHGVSGETLSRLKRGRIDAGFYLTSPEELNTIDQGGLHIIKLADFTYRIIGPVGWQKQMDNASWSDLAQLPWIGTPEASVHHRLLKPILAAHKITQNIVAEVDQEGSMLEVVRASVGLSLCRESIALAQKQSLGLALAPNIAVPACLCFATLPERHSDPLILALREVIERLWAG